MLKYLRFGLGVAVIVALIQFSATGSVATLVDNLAMVDVVDWLAMAVATLVSMVALGAAFRTSVQVIDVTLPAKFAFSYTIMNSFFNTVLPAKGGMWVRGYFLKRQFGISWKQYFFVLISGQLAQTALLIAVAVATIALANVPLLPTISLSKTVFTLIAIGVAISIGLVMFSDTVKTGIRLWTTKPAYVVSYLTFAAGFHLLSAIRLWLAFYVVGVPLAIAELTLLYSLMAAGLGWAFTPGNIGIKEAAIVILGGLLGVPADAALAASIVDRIGSLIVVIGIGGPISYQLTKTSDAQSDSKSAT